MEGDMVTQNSPQFRCECCVAGHLDVQLLPETIEYETEDGPISVDCVQVPFHVCDSCGSTFVTAETLRARHDYICEHLGIIKPSQIKQLRDRHRLSQAEFARITDFGVASLSRWERGRSLPNAGNNNYLLLLLEEPLVVEKLIARKSRVVHRQRSRVKDTSGVPDQKRNWHLPNHLLASGKERAARFSLS